MSKVTENPGILNNDEKSIAKKEHIGSHVSMATLPSRQSEGHLSHGAYRRRMSLMRATTGRSMSGRPRSGAKVHPETDSKPLNGNATTLNIDTSDIKGIDASEVELLQSENDPIRRKELLRQMVASIAIKRLIRAKVQPVKTVTGWQAWKQERRVAWNRFKLRMKEISIRLELWRSSFKTIEGHYGSGVVSYFVFLKWLFFLNAWIFLLVFVFVVIPQVALRKSPSYDQWVTGSPNLTSGETLAAVCSANYTVTVANNDVQQLILDFLQGTGWMEKTALFYGFYSNVRLIVTQMYGFTHYYNMPLAYILVTLVYFIISLILMVRHTGQGMKESLLSSEDTYYQYCNKVFGAWDYTMSDEGTTYLKQRSISNELQADLDEQRQRHRRANRTNCATCGLFAVRFLINFFVLAMLGGSGYLIYFVTGKSAEIKDYNDYVNWNKFVKLLLEYLPSLTLTILNVIVPIVFLKIVTFEDYRPETEVKVTLGRTVFLKLASLAVLMATLYAQVTCGTKDSCNVGIFPDCTILKCWETYVGQQLYKLVIMDFISQFVTVFFLEFPRRLLVTKCDCKIFKLVGQQEFEIPKNVLDLVYSQALCWLGAFFSPLIPAICFVHFFLLFYMKKLTCLLNYIPPSKPYRASRSNSFFMAVLVLTFLLCCIPVGYIIWKIPPSKGCGPFRIYSYMFSILVITIATWPVVLQQIMNFMTSAGFLLPCFIVLLLVIYYYRAVGGANKEMIMLLKEQLIMEGKDKQFLLAQLNRMTGHGPPGRDKKQGKHVHLHTPPDISPQKEEKW